MASKKSKGNYGYFLLITGLDIYLETTGTHYYQSK